MISVLTAGVAICRTVQLIREYKARSAPNDENLKANSASVSVDTPIEDELARDQVRQEANLTLTQDNLTTQQDSVVPDEVVLTSSQTTYKWSQPTFDQVISRFYKISTPTWSYTQSQNAAIAAFDVSKSLMNIQTLFDRIKRYQYWRAGVKVRLQVNSTQFHYGSLFAAIVPHYTAGESVPEPIENSVWSLSGQKCSGYLAANTGKPLELTCPFQVPNEYLDITQATGQNPFWLMVCVMNPLKVAGGSTNPTLQLSIFAQFTDFEILGPSELTANSSSKRVVKADKEQKNANKQGTLGKVAGAVSDVASKLTTIPVVGSVASAVAPIASAVGSIFDYFGWDKPTNISSQVFNAERYARGLQHGSGQDPSECIGLKPDQKISTEARHFGVEDEATRSFLTLLQTPMWHGSFTIANNQATESVFKRLWIRPYGPNVTYDVPGNIELQRHDYLSFYSQFFSSCRGGYRYYLHFDTSSYTTARVRITFEPSNSTIATITDGGDSFSRIIDVNGATSVVMEVPYCYPSARMPNAYSITADTASNGQLLFSLVNPIQTNGSSSDVIFVNVFRCAADDFRFYQPHIFTKTKTYVPATAPMSTRLFPNSLIEQLSSQTVTTLGDGPKVLFDRITEDEEVMSHNDYLHRYHMAFYTSSNKTPLYPTSGDAYLWMTPFRAYRGSVRLVSVEEANVLADGLVIGGVDTPEALTSAGAYLNGLDKKDVPIEVPYNNNVRFVPIRLPPTIYLDGYDRSLFFAGATSQRLFWSAGDDFTLGLRKAPSVIGVTI